MCLLGPILSLSDIWKLLPTKRTFIIQQGTSCQQCKQWECKMDIFVVPALKEGASQVVLVVKNPPANAGDVRNMSSIPRLRRSPGGGHGNPLQYSCLENPMDCSLAGYSPQGCKESARLTLSPSLSLTDTAVLLWKSAVLWAILWREPHDQVLKCPANSQQGIKVWPQPRVSLEMTTAMVNTLTAAPWETLSQIHPARQPLAAWPSEIVWDDKHCIKPLSVG